MGLSELLQLAIETLERLQIPYLVCGSVASGGYGEPRMTRDIDIVIDLRFGKVAELCEAFPAPDFFVSKEAAIEAIRTEKQFNVIHLASANKIDFMIARDCVWSRVQLERRQRIPLFGNVEGFTASPEDIVLSEMLYYHGGWFREAFARHHRHPQRPGRKDRSRLHFSMDHPVESGRGVVGGLEAT